MVCFSISNISDLKAQSSKSTEQRGGESRQRNIYKYWRCSSLVDEAVTGQRFEPRSTFSRVKCCVCSGRLHLKHK